MTDRFGFFALSAILALVGCAAMANTDAALMGRPAEPLEPGKHFVVTGSRASTIAACTRLIGIPAHTCVYQRTGDTIPTVYISTADIGAVYRHELYHVQQAARGEPMDHKGWR